MKSIFSQRLKQFLELIMVFLRISVEDRSCSSVQHRWTLILRWTCRTKMLAKAPDTHKALSRPCCKLRNCGSCFEP